MSANPTTKNMLEIDRRKRVYNPIYYTGEEGRFITFNFMVLPLK